MDRNELTVEPHLLEVQMGLGVVPDLLVSVDKLDLGWIRRWLSDYNDHKVAAP